MSWLVFGETGQIGRALKKRLGGEQARFISRSEVDFSDPEGLKNWLQRAAVPSAIIIAAAYTAVDKAEEESDVAMKVNAHSVGVIAAYAAERQIPLLHYSTDYVFDGSGTNPRQETAPTHPLNAYGKSKRAGEEMIEQAGGKCLILRTSWVYDATGKNFFNTMLRIGAAQETLRIVDDQIGAPCYAGHLADASIEVLKKAMQMDAFPSGIYHFCHQGETSWKGFAEAIFAEAKKRGIALKVKEVEGIASSEYPTPAKRPNNSRLDCTKLKEIVGVALPHWQEGLLACMEERNENHGCTA